jgi:peptidoglycan/LPS O-acetylase OafA/YrhL
LSEKAAGHLGFQAVLFIFFLPNLSGSVFPAVPYASQAWSIGVEEQFYLIQPWLVKKFKNLTVILSVIGSSYFLIKCLGMFAQEFYSNFYLTVFNNFWQTLNFDCLAIGGLAAVVLHKEKSILKILFRKYFQLITLLFTVFLLLKGVYIPYVHEEFYSLLFAIIILNLAANKQNILNLENPVLSYLGKISYGLYMYHTIAIVLALKFLIAIEISNIILLYGLSFALTILISAASYRFFEHKFISQKARFSKIITGDIATEQSKH